MIVEKIAGNIKDFDIGKLERDDVYIQWYEAGKKILHKTSRGGVEVGIRHNEDCSLHDGDILYMNDKKVLVLNILECECIVLKPVTMAEMGKACYEIGNRHAPLFIEANEIMTPFDGPLMTALLKSGFSAQKRDAVLKTPLGGHLHEHSHSH